MAGEVGGLGVVALGALVVEAVAGAFVDVDRDVGVVLGDRRGHLVGGDAGVRAAQVDDDGGPGRLGGELLHQAAVVAGGRGDPVQAAGREPGQRAAVAVADDADLLAAGLQEVAGD